MKDRKLVLRLRTALKLSVAVSLALFLGFHFQLGVPRWAAITAALVIAGPAFVAGEEPYTGAVLHRSLLRILGSLLGCLAALIIIMSMAPAPVLMLLLCCLWIGFCTWRSTLVRIDHSYGWALSGYTALIIVVTAMSTPGAIGLAPKFVIERSAEILLGVGSAVIAEILFLPRTAKRKVESLTEQLFVAHYQLMRDLCLFSQSLLPMARWASLQRQSARLGQIAGHLALESSHRQRSALRAERLYRLSLTLQTQAYAFQRLLLQAPAPMQEDLARIFAQEVHNTDDIRRQIKHLHWLHYTSRTGIPMVLMRWLGHMLRYRLLLRGVSANVAAHPVEKKLLQKTETATLKSAERHFAFINGLRAFIASFAGALLWGWTGWGAGSSFMIIIAVMCSLVMRTPSPVRTALDFIQGMLFSIPLGALYFLVIIPATQQSLFLLLFSISVLVFITGWAGQKQIPGMMGTIVGTLGLLVLSNPMNFNFLAFVDGALGQLIGSGIAFLVILLISDNSATRTQRALLCSLIRPVLRQLDKTGETGDILPALYAYLERLRQVVPVDEQGQRLAMSLIAYWHIMSARTQQPLPEFISLLREGERALDGMEHAFHPGRMKMSYIHLLQVLRKGQVLSVDPDMQQVFSALRRDLLTYRKSF